MSFSRTGILALMAHAGEDNLAVQFVHQSATNVSQKRDHTSVTFVTEKGNIDPADLMPGAKARKVGLIVWVDADKVEAWRKSL